jgi:hypothetical protein
MHHISESIIAFQWGAMDDRRPVIFFIKDFFFLAMLIPPV